MNINTSELDQGVQLVAFGETHHGRYDEDFRRIASDLNNIRTIYWEFPVNLQPSIDRYLSSGEVNEPLHKFIEGANKEGKDIWSVDAIILDAAKARGIPVICVDSSKVRTNEYPNKSTVGYYFLKGQSRDEDMFNKILDDMKQRDGMSLLICGATHLATDIHPRTNLPTLGKMFRENLGSSYKQVILS